MKQKESSVKFIVTGGPTREWLDPVRFISNASSGKMGIALADAAYDVSKNTVFIYGPIDTNLIKDKSYRKVYAESTEDMLRAVLAEIEDNTVLIMAAAPADYAPAEKSEIKIKKKSDELVIKLKKNPDILKSVSQVKYAEGSAFKKLILAGFAAETNDVEAYAKGKLVEKRLDLICANDVSQSGAGFNVDTNIITIYSADGEKIELSQMSKSEAAERIIGYVVGKFF